MQGSLSNTAVLENDDGVGGAADSFRRATFNWAVSTKRLVEAAATLGNNTKVARAALVDIEYARELLDKLFVPSAVKPPAFPEGKRPVTAREVRESVADLAVRVIKLPLPRPSLVVVDSDPPKPHGHRGSDLSAPVYSRAGKMLWAGIDCPVCPSKATQRCQKDDGGFIEKPHTQRKSIAEQS